MPAEYLKGRRFPPPLPAHPPLPACAPEGQRGRPLILLLSLQSSMSTTAKGMCSETDTQQLKYTHTAVVIEKDRGAGSVLFQRITDIRMIVD